MLLSTVLPQRMYSLTPNLESRFKLYLNILPVVEQGAMYLLFVTGAILILFTIYRLTFNVMFKTFDGNKNHRNFVIGTDLWIDREKNRKDKDSIYAPCEIPLNESDSDNSDPQFDTDRRPSLLKTHSDRIKELSYKLGDKVYDSVGSIKDKVTSITHVKNVFRDERKGSLVNKDDSIANDAYKSDSSDSDNYKGNYKAVKQSDSDDDCKYLEVVDDDEFDHSTLKIETKDRSDQLKRLESSANEMIIQISD